MDKALKHFRSFSELKKIAIKEVVGDNPPIGGGPRQSLPVPIRRQDQSLIAFMFCFYTFMPDLVQIWPPDTVVWLDPVDGKLIAKTAVSPADFGQTPPANEGFEWKFSMPPGMTTDSYAELRKHFFALYDALFEVWATSPSARSSALQNAAREFLNIFDWVSEPPLLSYYNALGREYFEWVQALAQ